MPSHIQRVESVRQRHGLWCGLARRTSISSSISLNLMRRAPSNWRRGYHKTYGLGAPVLIACLASASPISTNAEVTSGPPTRIRVGVFILFHS